MPPEMLSAIAFVIGMCFAMNTSRRATEKLSLEQLNILRAGAAATGTITRVWQPPLTGSFPRIYFSFQPDGTDAPIDCCHIDRRPQGNASLPAVGAAVSVRYLPDSPGSAVIAKLVSRFLQ